MKQNDVIETKATEAKATETKATEAKAKRGRESKTNEGVKIMENNGNSRVADNSKEAEAKATEAKATETKAEIVGYHQCAITDRSKAVELHHKLTETGKKLDYTKAIIVNSIVKASDDEAEAKEFILTNHLCDDKDRLNKLIRIVDRFITVDAKTIDGLEKCTVDVLKDKNGIKFSLTQLEEMLSVKTEDLVKLISEGKLKANMSCKGKEDSIREVVTPFKPNAHKNKSTKDKDKDKDKDGAKASCKNDKERIVLISKLLAEISTEQIVSDDMFDEIRERIAVYEEYAK